MKEYFLNESEHAIVSLKNKNPKTKSCLAIICETNALEKISGTSINRILKDSIELNLHFKKRSSSRVFFTENVLGLVEFDKSSNEYIVISAHYDHIGKKNGLIYNGADDDGSGTASIMVIAEALAKAKKHGIKLKRNFIFIGFTAEEKGLLGSRHYTDHPMIPLDQVVAGLNIDMIGRKDTLEHETDDYLYIIGSDMINTDLHDINEKAKNDYSGINLDYRFNNKDDPNQFYYRSDHYSFAKHDIPVIFYFRGVHEDYHKHTDTVDKILWDKLEKFSRHIFYTAWEIAKNPNMLTK
jgi:Zn-dependent M28 family amino/carboxypeptidase